DPELLANLVAPPPTPVLLAAAVRGAPRKAALARHGERRGHEVGQGEGHRTPDQVLRVAARAHRGETRFGQGGEASALVLRRDAYAGDAVPAARHERRAERGVPVALGHDDPRRTRAPGGPVGGS